MKEISREFYENRFGKNTSIVWGETPQGVKGPHIPWDEECTVYLISELSGVIFWPSCCHIYPFHIHLNG